MMEKFVITVVFVLMVTNVLVSADSDDDVVYDDKDLEGKHSSLSVLFVIVTVAFCFRLYTAEFLITV